MKVKEVETITGIKSKNIRFYEQQGLLCPARNDNGYREYTDIDIAILKKIKLLCQLNISLERIKSLQNGSLSISETMQEQINQLEKNISDLTQAKNICAMILKEEQTFTSINPDQYLFTISSLEKQGFHFGQITKDVIKQNILENVFTFIGINIVLILTVFLSKTFLTADGIYGKPTILLIFLWNNLWIPIFSYLPNDQLIVIADSLIIISTIILFLSGRYIKKQKNPA